MAKRSVLAVAPAALLAGCALTSDPDPVPEVRTVEVEVPVPVMPPAPPELMAPYRPEEAPRWRPPDGEGVSACLAPVGEQRLRRIVETLRARERAWRAWVIANREGSDDE